MFEQSLIDNGKRKAKSMIVATIGQLVMILCLVFTPIIWPSTMPLDVLAKSILVAPPAPPAPPPPPPAVSPAPRAVPRQRFDGKVFAPREVPRTDPRIIVDEPEGPPVVASDNSQWVPGGIPCGRPGLPPCGTVVGAIPGLPPLIAPPAPPPLPPAVKKKAEEPAATTQRIIVGGRIQEANLIHKVTPAYPPLAKQARVQGTVVLDAIISKEGRIEQLAVASGNPLLAPAAIAAVRQWTYRPTLLNDLPVEVVTRIEVKFMLSQ
jgi:protein TonB